MKPSRYNTEIPLRDGRLLLHNTASAAFAVLDASEAELLHQSNPAPSDAVDSLRKARFIVAESEDEIQRVEKLYNAGRDDTNHLLLTIAPTLACNFGCDYCFQGHDKPSGNMSAEVQDDLIHFAEKRIPAVGHCVVNWYGGEPLLALPAIERLSDELRAICESRNTHYAASIVTNGYKLTAKTARTLVSKGVESAQVTLDGDAPAHDARRALLGNQPTFERILSNLEEVVAGSTLQVTIRVNLDARNSASAERLLMILAERGFHSAKRFGIYFAPVEAITAACRDAADTTIRKREYAQLESRLQAVAASLGLAETPYPQRLVGLCQAVQKSAFVVVPNGDIHKCWDTVSDPRQRIGTLRESEALERDARHRQWLGWSPFLNDICRGCRLLPSCAGACAHKFVNPLETSGEAAALPCPSWKFDFRRRLFAHAVAKGAVDAGLAVSDELETKPGELGAVHNETEMRRAAWRRRLPVVEM